MKNVERDLTPILDRVARATHERAVAALPHEQQAGAPSYDALPPLNVMGLKQQLLPLVLDVLGALDEIEDATGVDDVFAALAAQFDADEADEASDRGGDHADTDAPEQP